MALSSGPALLRAQVATSGLCSVFFFPPRCNEGQQSWQPLPSPFAMRYIYQQLHLSDFPTSWASRGSSRSRRRREPRTVPQAHWSHQSPLTTQDSATGRHSLTLWLVTFSVRRRLWESAKQWVLARVPAETPQSRSPASLGAAPQSPAPQPAVPGRALPANSTAGRAVILHRRCLRLSELPRDLFPGGKPSPPHHVH